MSPDHSGMYIVVGLSLWWGVADQITVLCLDRLNGGHLFRTDLRDKRFVNGLYSPSLSVCR